MGKGKVGQKQEGECVNIWGEGKSRTGSEVIDKRGREGVGKGKNKAGREKER